jgi:hypothetical protein
LYKAGVETALVLSRELALVFRIQTQTQTLMDKNNLIF